MKKIFLFLSIFIVISCKGNQDSIGDTLAVQSNKEKKLKRYDVKSGAIKYKITISGKVMGSTITGSGTEYLFFKDWGAIELVESNSKKITNMKFFGKTKTETTKTHTMNKLDNGESYQVDFDNEVIYLRRDPAMDLMMQSNSDAGETGKNILEAFGGKKTGTEVYKGYHCEIWDIAGAKQWMYKGVPLKMVVNVMGIKTVKETVTADFNTTVTDQQLKLPDYTIQKEASFMDNEEFENDMEDIDANMDKLSKMSFAEWKKVALADKEDEEMQNMSDEKLRETYNLIQKMIKAKKAH